jgi:hypothetical protein
VRIPRRRKNEKLQFPDHDNYVDHRDVFYAVTVRRNNCSDECGTGEY